MPDPAFRWPGDADVLKRAGQCYTLAMEAVLLNIGSYSDRLFLVHGIMHGDRAEGIPRWEEMHPGIPRPPANPHAWVEIDCDDGPFSIDPVVRCGWPAEEHVRLFGAETIKRYRSDVAVDVAIRRDNYGPWDRRSLDAWETRRKLSEQDPRYAQTAAFERYLEGASYG